MEETLTDRFNRLTDGMSDAEVATIMGVTEGAVRKLRKGDTKSFDFHRALRLCDRLGIDPWYLAYGRARQVGSSAKGTGGFVVSLLADLAPAANAQDRLQRIESRVDLLTRVIQTVAGVRAETLETGVAPKRRKRQRPT